MAQVGRTGARSGRRPIPEEAALQQVQIPRYGDPEVLTVIERDDPRPGEGEVSVAVRAAGINFADVLARMGLYQDPPVDRAFPHTEAPAAHRYIQERRNFGKVVLTFDE